MKKIFFILLTIAALNVQAGNFYVNPSTGNNANAGTVGSPWQTILHARANVSAGDTIWLQPGTYTENSQIVLGVRVSLKATGDTSNTIVNTNYAGGAFLSLESTTNGTEGQQVISGITFNGQNTAYRAGMIYLRSHVSIFNCKFLNFVHDGINFKGLQNSDINVGNFYTHGLQHNGLNGTPTFSVGNKFYNNRMSNCAEHNGTYAYGSLSIGGQDSLQVYGNTITNTERGTNLNGEPIKLQVDILGFIKNSRINNNVLKAATRNPFTFDNIHFDFAIELFYCTDVEIDHNDLEGSIDVNWQFAGTNYSVWIHENNIHEPSFTSAGYASGIVLEFDTYNAIIEDNIISRCSQGIVFTTRNGCYIQNTIVRNNRITDMGIYSTGYPNGYAITNTPGYSGISIVNSQFYHNTATATSDAGAAKPQYGMCFFGLDTMENCTIRDNLLVGQFQDQTLYFQPVTALKNNTFTKNATYGGNYNGLFQKWDGVNLPDGTNTFSGNWEGTQNPSLNSSFEVTNSNLINAGSDGLTIGYNASGSGDVTPPTVSSTNPANSATGVTPGAYNIIINFGEAMNTATINSTNITGISGTITAASTYASIAATLAPSTTYTITVNGVQDAAGNTIAAPYVFSFTTAAAPPAPSGDGRNKMTIKILRNN